MEVNEFHHESEDSILNQIYAHFNELLALQESKENSGRIPREAVREIIVDHLIDMILALDSDFSIRYVNRVAQEYLQYTPEEIQGKNLFHFLHPSDAEKLRNPLSGVWIQPQRKFKIKEVRLRRKGDGWSSLEAIGKVVNRNVSEPLLLMSFRSIREEVDGADTANKSSSGQSSVGAAALQLSLDYEMHLAIIKKAVQSLDPSQLNDAQHYYLKMITTMIARSDSESRRFRTYLNPPTPNQKRINVGQLLNNFQITVAPLFPSNYRISVQDGSPDLQIICDPGQIQQVLSILCSNALEAMPEGGEIMLGSGIAASAQSTHNTVGRRTKHIQIRVHDTGHGINPAIRLNLFEPYTTTKIPRRGRGLGLAIARRLLERQGGWIDVDTEEHSGTTMVFGLPIARDTKKFTGESENTTEGGESAILGMEDEMDLRQLIQTVVRKHSGK